MNPRLLTIVLAVIMVLACKEVAKKSIELPAEQVEIGEIEIGKAKIGEIEIGKKSVPVIPEVPVKKLKSLEGIPDSTFIRLADYDADFAYDLRYATKNNFLKEKVYKCGECYVRSKTARALLKANEDFKKVGLRIRFFDCYRPNSVQHKMWELVPNPKYVANPKKGSIHNKGGAVDITLETLEGEKLDMGTDFDFFGKRAHHDSYDLPKQILKNRKLLKNTMKKHGLRSLRSEWWHYHLQGAHKYPIENFEWGCD